MIGWHSTTATWRDGYNAQAICMDHCAKPIHVPPEQCVEAAICPPTTAAKATASCQRLVKLGRLAPLLVGLASPYSGAKATNWLFIVRVMAELRPTTSMYSFARQQYTNCLC